MNNFLEFINKDVEGKRALIETLPTKTKSNKILTKQDIPTNNNGNFEFPSPLKILLITL